MELGVKNDPFILGAVTYARGLASTEYSVERRTRVTCFTTGILCTYFFFNEQYSTSAILLCTYVQTWSPNWLKWSDHIKITEVSAIFFSSHLPLLMFYSMMIELDEWVQDGVAAHLVG